MYALASVLLQLDLFDADLHWLGYPILLRQQYNTTISNWFCIRYFIRIYVNLHGYMSSTTYYNVGLFDSLEVNRDKSNVFGQMSIAY
jgi:hypothetical protein